MMQPADLNSSEWNKIVSNFAGAHILQSWEWGEFKAANGWKVHRFVWKDDYQIYAAAQLLEKEQRFITFKGLPGILYSPRGPILDWNKPEIVREVLDDIQEYGKSRNSIFLKIDPEVEISDEVAPSLPLGQQKSRVDVVSTLMGRGWNFSRDQIQFRNTVWVDLSFSETELLNSMKQKTRYNIRLAERKGVRIRKANPADFTCLYELYAKTGIRDGFIIRPKEYYLTLWNLLFENNMATALIADVDDTLCAGLFLFYFANKAWYFYGMSSDVHREKMPNYLLQWEAIKLAKSLGCKIYDLWGAPNTMDESDPMWGVYRFKEGLGGKLVKTIGAWDFPEKKVLYFLYNHVIPRILSITRYIRKKELKAETTR